MAQDQPVVFTIGHSNHPRETFLELLRGAAITTVADVRSIPRSRRWPHFGGSRLKQWLAEAEIGYMYFGAELGGRPADPTLLTDGRPDYSLMAASPSFKGGIDRVLERARRDRLALMCAEREPLDCHRFLLVSRALRKRDLPIHHILADGTVETQETTEQRLLRDVGLAADGLFTDLPPPDDLIARAYERRSAKIHGSFTR